MVACYATGVWAFCALPVLVRGYYALGDRTTPVKIGAAAVALNLLLSFTLIWPLAERGLALSTSIAAGVQVIALLLAFSRDGCRLTWDRLAATLLRSGVATAVMGAATFATGAALPASAGDFTRLALPVAAGVAVYLAVLRSLRAPELRMLTGRAGENE